MKKGDKIRYARENCTIEKIFIQENSSPSGDILLKDESGILFLVHHNELINRCINCHYFETEESYLIDDKNGNERFIAPCYLSDEYKCEDNSCEKIKVFEYYKEFSI